MIGPGWKLTIGIEFLNWHLSRWRVLGVLNDTYLGTGTFKVREMKKKASSVRSSSPNHRLIIKNKINILEYGERIKINKITNTQKTPPSLLLPSSRWPPPWSQRRIRSPQSMQRRIQPPASMRRRIHSPSVLPMAIEAASIRWRRGGGRRGGGERIYEGDARRMGRVCK